MLTAVVIVSIVYTLTAAARAPTADTKRAFHEFTRAQGRHYRDADETRERLQAFTASLADAAHRNANLNELAEFGVTKFSDYTTEEFLGNFTTGLTDDDIFVRHSEIFSKYGTPLNISALSKPPPDAFDWRDHNAVTKVKDQGKNCSASYAFAMAGSIESQYAISTKKLLDLSVQQIISCCGFGCSSDNYFGQAVSSWWCLMYDGIASEADYPYEENESSCKADKKKAKAFTRGFFYMPIRSGEDDLRSLLELGPVIIALDGTSFKNYKGGILTNCQHDGLPNVEMLIVGYGAENGVPFWILKTSYGEDFGEKGYIRIKRNVNACGINFFQLLSSVPVVRSISSI